MKLSLYDALKALAETKDKQLEKVIDNYLSPNSSNSIIRRMHTENANISDIVENYIKEEQNKEYTWKDCIPFRNTVQTEITALLGVPLLTKQDYLSITHKASVLFTSICGLVAYLSGFPTIPTVLTGIILTAALADTYNDLLKAPKTILEYEAVAIARAKCIDEELSKRIKKNQEIA